MQKISVSEEEPGKNVHRSIWKDQFSFVLSYQIQLFFDKKNSFWLFFLTRKASSAFLLLTQQYNNPYLKRHFGSTRQAQITLKIVGERGNFFRFTSYSLFPLLTALGLSKVFVASSALVL